MKLICIGSSSKGNSYILESSSEILLLEAGIRLREVTSNLNADKNVVGIAYSHEHQDHSKYIESYQKRFGVDTICPDNAVAGRTYSLGQFRITPFAVYHDCKCYGYLIHHKEMGTLLFLTDTFASPCIFKNVNHWLVEANYADEILEANLASGKIDKKQYERILVSHMSLENCIKNLVDGEAWDSQTITLVHLSERNSDADMFSNKVSATFGIPCQCAHKGLIVNLNKDEV